MQRYLEHPERIRIPHLAVRLSSSKDAMRIFAASTDNEFPYAVLGIGLAIRVSSKPKIYVTDEGTERSETRPTSGHKRRDGDYDIGIHAER